MTEYTHEAIGELRKSEPTNTPPAMPIPTGIFNARDADGKPPLDAFFSSSRAPQRAALGVRKLEADRPWRVAAAFLACYRVHTRNGYAVATRLSSPPQGMGSVGRPPPAAGPAVPDRRRRSWWVLRTHKLSL